MDDFSNHSSHLIDPLVMFYLLICLAVYPVLKRFLLPCGVLLSELHKSCPIAVPRAAAPARYHKCTVGDACGFARGSCNKMHNCNDELKWQRWVNLILFHGAHECLLPRMLNVQSSQRQYHVIQLMCETSVFDRFLRKMCVTDVVTMSQSHQWSID